MFNRKSDVERIHSRSKGIVSVFTKTITDLTSVNEAIDDATSKKYEEKEKLENEIGLLNSLKADHMNVIAKITSIFK